MRMLMIVFAAAAAVLGGAAAVSLVHAEDVGVAVELMEIDGSGITGSAELTSTTEDLSTTDVLVDMGGLDANGTHVNHIHDGTGCASGDYGAIVITLTDLAADDTGSAQATTTVTENDAGDPVSFTDIADGNHVIIVHDAAGAPASCAHIPAAEVDEQPAATATVSAVPATGIATEDGGPSAAIIALVVAGLAALGVAALGFGYTVRRARS